LNEILEIEIDRKFLWTEGFGKLALRVELYDGGQLLEKWPETDSIALDMPKQNKEIFWH
jgi:hypothetical protein